MEQVGNIFYFEWEVSLIVWLQAHLNSFGVMLASFFSEFGEELVCVAVIGFLYWCYDKQFGRYVAKNLLIAQLLNPMIKNIALRRRPYFDKPQIECLKPVDKNADIYNIAAQGYSFPSGHATNAAAVYGSLARYKRKGRLLAVIMAVLTLLVGVSRFCLGVHYPTDVLGGWILGLIVVFTASWIEQKINNQLLFYGLVLLIGLPGFFYCKSADYFTGYGLMLGFIAADLFEQKYVRFKNTRNKVGAVVRLVAGIGVFFGLNTLLKLPFSSEFLNSSSMAAMLVRTLRYAIVLFLVLGVYPMSFRFMEKWFREPAGS